MTLPLNALGITDADLAALRKTLAQRRKAAKAASDARRAHQNRLIALTDAALPKWDTAAIGSDAYNERNNAWSRLVNAPREAEEYAQALALATKYGVDPALITEHRSLYDVACDTQRRSDAALDNLQNALAAVAAVEPEYTGRGPVGYICEAPDGTMLIVKLTTTNDYKFAALKQDGQGRWRVCSAHSRRELVPADRRAVPVKTTKPIR